MTTKKQGQHDGEGLQLLSPDLETNLGQIKSKFAYPENIALLLRQVYIPYLGKEGTLLFLDGATNIQVLEEHIIQPLIGVIHNELPEPGIADTMSLLAKNVLSAAEINKIIRFRQVVQDLLYGNTILLVDGEAEALSFQTPGFESRSVTEPTNENILKGPKESFIESAIVNRSLIRKQMKDHRLMTESILIGDQSPKKVYVLYVKDVADPELVKRIKKKVGSIESGNLVQSLSILEQFIEDRPYSLLPDVLVTERPDRACSFLNEGHVVLLMDNSPAALIAPVTFWSLFHTSEDTYLRWAYGNFVRLIRLFAVFVALMTPSIYLAISTFHEEMFPTDLLLAIAATRERVPFPAFVEVLIMEVTFELVREAGIRIPKAIGPTIGIVGALILGQAAVEANIISPILVIIVALTGLSSFAVPEISMNFAVRILRFFMLISANFMGFFGVALLLTCVLAYMVSFESFGVPFMSPLSPHYRSSKDLIVRPPVWKQWLRPMNMRPQDRVRSTRRGGDPKR